MLRLTQSATFATAAIAAAFATGAAQAQEPPTGTWIDHTGRGAVEITECGAALCGRVVWVKDRSHADTCGTQIIGNVKRMSGGTWDGGWIYDPDAKSKYSVELKPVGADKLRVVGYLGSKLFSETMTWKRPAGPVERCDGVASAVEPAKTVEPAAPAKVEAAAPTPVPASPPASASISAPVVASAAPLAAAPIKPASPATETRAKAKASPADAVADPPSSGKTKRAGSDCKVKIPYVGITVSCKDLPEEFRLAASKFGS